MKLTKTFATIDNADKAENSLSIRNSTTVGAVGSNPVAVVSAVEIIIKSSGEYFSGIEVKLVDDEGNSSDSELIDKKQLSSFIDAVDVVANFKFRSDRYQQTEVIHNMDELKIISFKDEDEIIRSAIQIGDDLCLLQKQSDLLDFKNLLEITMEYIGSIEPE